MKMAFTSCSALPTFICLCFVASSLAQKLILTHAPSYVTVQQQQSKPLSASEIPSVISNTLGISGSQKTPWSGVQSGSLFKRPKASVLLTVVTTQTSGENDISPQGMASFPVEADIPLVDFSSVMNAVQSSFLEEEPLMLDLVADNNFFDINTPNDVFNKLPTSMRSLADQLLDGDSVLSKLKVGSLNHSYTPDQKLLAELQLVDHVLKTLNGDKSLTNGKTPDLFSFAITGLKSVMDAHGTDSDQARDAHRIMTDFIDSLTKDFRKIYNDNVVVQVLVVPAPEKGQVRKVRGLLQATSPSPSTTEPFIPSSLNLEWDYDQDYPAMFNIILWIMVAWIISVFVIAYGMWNMDPGRDSIIYRMTSQRLKKD
ncbi:hypothetical protein C0Q70_20930 [Pomacea canaliculata]|uniref:Renin receptor n=1 Tax=Pomacea canaliculata TaxID=400727 RepID=A0A2T7NB47_POMCA|nr:hypothetical protein C0Q70_20930 [Pomacea canaliculata]